MSGADKDIMRRLILDHTEYTPDQWREIEVLQAGATLSPEPFRSSTPWHASIDLPRALHRGRYMVAVARQERCGLPVRQSRV